MESQGTPSSQNNKNKVGFTLPEFKTYYPLTIAIKRMWCGHEHRHTDKWSRTECAGINSHTYDYVISTRWPRPVIGGETSFQPVTLGKLDIYVQKDGVGPLPNILHRN